MDPRIYLDNNATTAIDPSVIRVMTEDLSSPPANPSSMHFYGQQAKNKLTKARQTLASYFKVKPTEIIFTSGGTESMNTLIRGLFTQTTTNKSHIISSNVEHSSVEKTLLTLKEQGCEVTFLPVGLSGILSSETLENAITSHTKLLVFSAVNSETGIKQDLEKLSRIALKHAIPLVIDGVALLGKDPFEIQVPLPESVSRGPFQSGRDALKRQGLSHHRGPGAFLPREGVCLQDGLERSVVEMDRASFLLFRVGGPEENLSGTSRRSGGLLPETKSQFVPEFAGH